jgi:hypothetical protein
MFATLHAAPPRPSWRLSNHTELAATALVAAILAFAYMPGQSAAQYTQADFAADPSIEFRPDPQNWPLRPTAAMFEAADRVAQLDEKRQQELGHFMAAIAEKCKQGDIDSCFVESHYRRKSTISYPPRARNPATEWRTKQVQTAYVIAMCKKGHIGFCTELGFYINGYASTGRIPSIDFARGLEDTLSDLGVRDPRPGPGPSADAMSVSEDAWEKGEFIPRMVNMLSRGGWFPEAPASELAIWFDACRHGRPVMCTLGAAFLWRAEGGRTASSSEPGVWMYQTLDAYVVTALRQHCESTGALCETAAVASARAMNRSCEGACQERREGALQERLKTWCAAGNASACDGPQPERACELGSASGCDWAVTTAMDRRDYARSLGYAIQACQRGRDCGHLFYKFIASREFTDVATGKMLAGYACERGLLEGCDFAAATTAAEIERVSQFYLSCPALH